MVCPSCSSRQRQTARSDMSAYMSTRHVKPPPPLFLLFFLSFFLPFSSSTAPQAFPSPRPQDAAAGARRVCQGWPLFAATVRLGLYTTEHDGRLHGFGRLLLSCYLSVIVSARVIPITNVAFRQVLLRSPWRVRCSHQLISGSSDPAYQGAACMDDRAGGMGLIFRTADWQTPICDADIQPHIQPARHTRLGCRNSAQCRRYRVRVAPCGTRPCSR
jgi:hypothetical protein